LRHALASLPLLLLLLLLQQLLPSAAALPSSSLAAAGPTVKSRSKPLLGSALSVAQCGQGRQCCHHCQHCWRVREHPSSLQVSCFSAPADRHMASYRIRSFGICGMAASTAAFKFYQNCLKQQCTTMTARSTAYLTYGVWHCAS
jgi:hypothetical protein